SSGSRWTGSPGSSRRADSPNPTSPASRGRTTAAADRLGDLLPAQPPALLIHARILAPTTDQPGNATPAAPALQPTRTEAAPGSVRSCGPGPARTGGCGRREFSRPGALGRPPGDPLSTSPSPRAPARPPGRHQRLSALRGVARLRRGGPGNGLVVLLDPG